VLINRWHKWQVPFSQQKNNQKMDLEFVALLKMGLFVRL